MTNSGDISFLFHLTPFRLRHRNAIRDWLSACVQEEGTRIEQLNYMFSTDDYVLSMNEAHLDHSYYTDILTFPMPSGQGISGDILISIDRTRDNAKLLNHRPLDELHRVMAHGALHLIGYNDDSESNKENMRKKEDQWLSRRSFLD